MSLFHAVVWVDHHNARVLQFDTEHVETQTVKAHKHLTRQHGSTVRTEHEFFAEVCDAMEGIQEILLTGSHIAMADLLHYVNKHRAPLGKRIVGNEKVDKPSDKQLLALAREYFLKYDRMIGTPTPS